MTTKQKVDAGSNENPQQITGSLTKTITGTGLMIGHMITEITLMDTREDKVTGHHVSLGKANYPLPTKQVGCILHTIVMGKYR